MRIVPSTTEKEQHMLTPKEEMLRLAATTQFGGPGYIIESRFLTERSLWFVIFALLTGLTIRDLYSTISDYVGGPTSTDTAIRFNETMTFNGTTFCVQYNSMKLDWGVDLKRPERTQAILESFSVEPDILAMIQHETHSGSPSNSATLISLIMLTTTMLGNIFRLENVKFANLDDVDNQWGTTKVVNQRFHIDNETTESIASVYRFYAKRNVSFVELLPVTAKLVLKQMFATLYCVRQSQPSVYMLLHESRITWFGRVPFGLKEERLCFKPRDGVLTFGSSGDGCVTKITPTAIYPSDSNGGVAGTVMFDLSGHKVPQSDVSNMWGLAAGEKQQVDIQLMGKYTSLNRRSLISCDDDENAPDIVDCKGACRASKIYQMCECWPLSWWHLRDRPSGARYCTQPRDNAADSENRIPDLTTKTCNYTHYSYVIDDDCAAKCRQKCTQMIFVFRNAELERSLDSPFSPDAYNSDESWDNRTVIYMNTPTFIYPETTQSWSFDLGRFFSDLGGNISLWLGGSIIGLAHIIITSCRVFVDAKFGRQVKEREAKFCRKLKNIGVTRFVQRELTPADQRELHQQYAYALRTHNAQTVRPNTDVDNIEQGTSVGDERMARQILVEAAARESALSIFALTTGDLATLLQRVATLEEKLDRYKKRLEHDA